jgi:hypothetical protein
LADVIVAATPTSNPAPRRPAALRRPAPATPHTGATAGHRPFRSPASSGRTHGRRPSRHLISHRGDAAYGAAQSTALFHPPARSRAVRSLAFFRFHTQSSVVATPDPPPAATPRLGATDRRTLSRFHSQSSPAATTASVRFHAPLSSAASPTFGRRHPRAVARVSSKHLPGTTPGHRRFHRGHFSGSTRGQPSRVVTLAFVRAISGWSADDWPTSSPSHHPRQLQHLPDTTPDHRPVRSLASFGSTHRHRPRLTSDTLRFHAQLSPASTSASPRSHALSSPVSIAGSLAVPHAVVGRRVAEPAPVTSAPRSPPADTLRSTSSVGRCKVLLLRHARAGAPRPHSRATARCPSGSSRRSAAVVWPLLRPQHGRLLICVRGRDRSSLISLQPGRSGAFASQPPTVATSIRDPVAMAPVFNDDGINFVLSG